MQTIYLDHAATSFPKPHEVAEAMTRYVETVGATINRSIYGAALEAELTTLALREQLCRLFGLDDPSCVILTAGATMALNQAISGFLHPGDHVLVSGMEHNAVMRPLLRLLDVSCTRVPCDHTGKLEPSALPALVQPNTRLFLLSHASNVCGTLQDAAAVGAFCQSHGIAFVLDAAQTAGHLDLDFGALGLSALAVPGHKGLLGPQGIGALLLTRDFAAQLTPLIAGGTGSASDAEDMPPFLPDRLEAGTPNLPGIYGWQAALTVLEQQGIRNRRARETALTRRFLDGLATIPAVSLVGTRDLHARVGVIAVDFHRLDNADASDRLATEYGVLTRCGLHCAPAAHRTLGTFPRGVVRFSLGYTTTEAEIDAALDAIRAVSAG